MIYKIGYKNCGTHIIDTRIIVREIEALSIVSALHKLARATQKLISTIQICYIYMHDNTPFYISDFDYINLIELPVYKMLGNHIYKLDGPFTFIWTPILPQENVYRAETSKNPPVSLLLSDDTDYDHKPLGNNYMKDMWGFLDEDDGEFFDSRYPKKDIKIDTKKYKHTAILEK